MKVKIGNDDFCLYCMEWREIDKDGRCKICKHLIHRDNKKQDKKDMLVINQNLHMRPKMILIRSILNNYY